MFSPTSEGSPAPRSRSWLRGVGSIALLGCATANIGGCVREPHACELQLERGDVIITEIRGPQDGTDTRGEWFELYNATDAMVDLFGLRGELVNLRGSIEINFIVRESLPVGPGEYVVLGSLANAPPEVDYSFNDDFAVEPRLEDSDGTLVVPVGEDSDPRELFSNARVELFACDQLIETVIYEQLPAAGTFSFDGARSPSADDNDDLSHWCTNDAEAPEDGPQTEIGLPGSPGEANPPCP